MAVQTKRERTNEFKTTLGKQKLKGKGEGAGTKTPLLSSWGWEPGWEPGWEAVIRQSPHHTRSKTRSLLITLRLLIIFRFLAIVDAE